MGVRLKFPSLCLHISTPFVPLPLKQRLLWKETLPGDGIIYSLIPCVGTECFTCSSPTHWICSLAGCATVPLLPNPVFCSPYVNLKTVFKRFLISQGLFSCLTFLHASLHWLARVDGGLSNLFWGWHPCPWRGGMELDHL